MSMHVGFTIIGSDAQSVISRPGEILNVESALSSGTWLRVHRGNAANETKPVNNTAERNRLFMAGTISMQGRSDRAIEDRSDYTVALPSFPIKVVHCSVFCRPLGEKQEVLEISCPKAVHLRLSLCRLCRAPRGKYSVVWEKVG